MVALLKDGKVIGYPAQGKNNEWFTPRMYIEAAREVMGGNIDLDPASCELANRTVQAVRYYTKEDDGLSRSWKSKRMWLNPPYGKVNPIPGSTRSYQKLFVEKLLRERIGGNIEQAIMLLLGNCCFAHYFYPLWEYPLCFHDGCISFYKPDGTTGDFGFGTIFVYMGPHVQKFVQVFSQFGRITRAIDTPRKNAVPLSLWEVAE